MLLETVLGTHFLSAFQWIIKILRGLETSFREQAASFDFWEALGCHHENIETFGKNDDSMSIPRPSKIPQKNVKHTKNKGDRE